jgi:hypothetical protein
MNCPICKGTGEQLIDYFDWGAEYEECYACYGSGKKSLWWFLKYWFFNTSVGNWVLGVLYDI